MAHRLLRQGIGIPGDVHVSNEGVPEDCVNQIVRATLPAPGKDKTFTHWRLEVEEGMDVLWVTFSPSRFVLVPRPHMSL